VFVARIPHGHAFGTTGDVLSAELCILADLSVPNPRRISRSTAELFPVFRQNTLPRPVELRGTLCVLTSQWAHDNYFHWMLNLLPRVALMRQAGVDPSRADHVMISEQSLPFQRESIAAVGLPGDRLVVSRSALLVQADAVWATSSLRAFGHTCEWAHTFLRSTFAGSIPPAGGGSPDRLFVTRPESNRRRIANEEEVFRALEPLGFVRTTLAGLSIEQQARLFSAARVVVAPHGAALTNIVFCQPGASIVEIFPPRRPRAYFWEMASTLGLEYRYLVGRGMDGGREGDFIISPEWIMRTLSSMAVA